MPQIFDLNNSPAIKGEKYFIDTNVWYWTTYISSKIMGVPNQPAAYQIKDYPRFLERAIEDGAVLCHCPMTFSELANIIENTELCIYQNENNKQGFPKKEFRNIPDERAKVLKEIDIAWTTINSMSTCIDANLCLDFISGAQGVMSEGCLDPFDALYVQVMRRNNIDYIVTDDHDFCSINQQMIFTSNKKSLGKKNSQ
jgi:predicted nucleic acid-binding protein